MKGRIFLLMQLLHLAVSLKTDCPHECITIDTCPELAAIIKTKTRVVQEATCSFLGQMPLVCCPISTSPTPTNPPPTPTLKPPTTSLLPKQCGHFPLDGKLHGGNRTRLGSYPWMAALGYRNSRNNKIEFLCGGSVIHERYILTAAHCLAPREPEVIRLGEWDFTTEEDCEITDTETEYCAPNPAQDYRYEKIVMHPDYDTRAKVSDDIGLIKLRETLNFRRNKWIQPVCIPERNFDLRAAVGHRNAIVTGWGMTENGTTSDVLLQVSLPIVDMQTCNVTYRGRLIGEQICFGGVLGKDSCGGDSGGPLVVTGSNAPPFIQIGIVSFGPRDCGKEGVPGVYTGVANYKDWIEQTLRQ